MLRECSLAFCYHGYKFRVRLTEKMGVETGRTDMDTALLLDWVTTREGPLCAHLNYCFISSIR